MVVSFTESHSFSKYVFVRVVPHVNVFVPTACAAHYHSLENSRSVDRFSAVLRVCLNCVSFPCRTM